MLVVEQPDDGGEHLLLAQRARFRVLVDLAPDLGQRLAELGEQPANLLASALARKSA
jgi:hypothetical protein